MLRRVLVGSAIAAGSWYGFYRLTRWRATWGVDDEEGARPLPGDDLIAQATASDTRGITIDAPPDRVWPWLVQMGYGRAGWYSYDALDMQGASETRVVPELQSLAVGDTMPTDPDGGFEVRTLEPCRALVLFVDEAITARRSRPVTAAGATTGLEASGRFLDAATPPEFAASWAFVLEPIDGARTRLLERVRVRFGSATRTSRVLGPLFGFGVFVMTQRQMVGIKARAEALADAGHARPDGDVTHAGVPDDKAASPEPDHEVGVAFA